MSRLLKRGPISELIRANKMILVRQTNHLCYRHPDGRTFVMAKSPSDRRAELNILRTLKKFLAQPAKQPSTRAKKDIA